MTAIRLQRPFKRGALRWATTALLLATVGQPIIAETHASSQGFPVNSPPAGEQPGVASAVAALARFGIPADRLSFSLKPDAGAAHYRVRIRDGRIVAEGTSAVALVRGVVATLEKLGRMHVSWEGRRLGSLDDLPDTDTGQVTSPFSLRAYLNTCTYGYTTPWWGWDRWEQEIDWMAAHGVDTPLAMEGQEYVWQALWREAGLNDEAIARGFSAAPFLPWQRMGNLAGYRAPLSQDWIEKKHQLQLRILARMRALGMKPVLPAFAGYVPEVFAKAHPEAKIYKMRAWEGFPPTYWLDPSDPLFAQLAGRFIAIYNRTYGEGDYYLADAFNEMIPPIAEDGSDAAAAAYGDAIANTAATRAAALPPAVRNARLAAYGERLYKSITAAAPSATWAMQGWLFGADKAFWTPEAVGAFLSRVPDEKMLILDIGNDRYPGIWRKTDAFDGKAWTYGYVHNYGGSNPVYGDLEFYRTDMAALQANPRKGRLAGFGMFPEGLHSNSIVYDYAYDLAWGENGRPLEDWLAEHLRARYGEASPALLQAWQQAISGAYRTRYWEPRWWQQHAGAYLFFKRPLLEGADYPPGPGDPEVLRAGILALLASAPAKPSPLLTYDIVDLTRHYLSLALDGKLRATLAAYRDGHLAEGDRSRADMVRLARRIDLLAGNQQETLGSWIADARAYGGSAAEKDRFEEHAKAIVTVWGGEGHLSDYASRAWQGLYAGYYLTRWEMFLDAQRAAAAASKPLDEATVSGTIRAWEQEWVVDGRTWARKRPGDPIGLTRQMLEETRP